MVRCALLVGIFLFGIAERYTFAGEHRLNGHMFTLLDGFEIELVANSPLVERPITADFDELGRLYVADSSGSNDKVQQQLEERTHRIVRLEDINGDGKFDKSVVFADKMMFPEGTLWYDGSLYVAAPPSIWKLTDTNGDGLADERKEWFAGKTLTGCANDLHGPYLGRDGWIYWCKGAFAEQTYEQPGKKPLVTKAAHIFRRRANGTGPIENVMTGGMDNPVDVVFTPGGERIFTTTFLQNPGGGLRDGLIHAIYGGVYGKVHNVTDFHPRTGDLLPPLVHMGAAAPCGLTLCESDLFGKDTFRHNVLACQFNMHKVSRHVLQHVGATFSSTDSDFVVSDNIDFHPTDVLEDADGSLIICDTGGWYKLCCPTSQLSKPDVLGAIYRVRPANRNKLDDPRGLKIRWSELPARELVLLLEDGRHSVRQRAIHLLANNPVDAITALKPVLLGLEDGTSLTVDQAADVNEPRPRRRSSGLARLNAVWTLTRIDSAEARALIRGCLFDSSLTVRQAALHSVSLWRDHLAMPHLLNLLVTCIMQNQRVAAECLGRLEDKSAVPDLLASLRSDSRKLLPSDRVLAHAVTYALIEIADPAGTSAGLDSSDPAVHRTALIALDQMHGGRVDPQRVVSLLSSKDPILKQTALWLVGRHSDWADSLAGYLKERLESTGLSESEQAELVQHLTQFSGHAAIRELLANHARPQPSTGGDASTSRRMALDAMRASSLKELPSEWSRVLIELLDQGEPAMVPLAIGVLRSFPPPKEGIEPLRESLLRILDRASLPMSVRVEAWAAIPGTFPSPQPNQLQTLLTSLGEETSVATRSAAVEALVKSKLDPKSLLALSEAIPIVGPLELNRLLGAFEHSSDEAVGLKLVGALKQSPVLTSLRVDSVKLRIAKFPAKVQTEAEALYAAINVEAGRQKERLDQITGSLGAGDVRRGQLVFQNSKAACSACHAIGYLGGTIGPDLSRIGKIRTERDLLESLLFPSVSFVRSYEPILIVTKSGKQYSGLIRRETADEITLVTGAKEEARISRDEIEEIRPGTVSIMPAGLDTQLTQQQLADLIAFLKSRQ